MPISRPVSCWAIQCAASFRRGLFNELEAFGIVQGRFLADPEKGEDLVVDHRKILDAIISFAEGAASMKGLIAGEQFRGRVMGVRMLMIYGVPIGLLIAGPLIGRFGYPLTATLYCAIGLVVVLLIAVRWRGHIWNLAAPANKR